jgi:hypothetical protein
MAMKLRLQMRKWLKVCCFYTQVTIVWAFILMDFGYKTAMT